MGLDRENIKKFFRGMPREDSYAICLDNISFLFYNLFDKER